MGDTRGPGRRPGDAADQLARRRPATTRASTARSASSRADYQMAVLKTASNFQWFRPIASGVIRADTPGPDPVGHRRACRGSAVPRPIYPLDETASWRG